MRVFVAMAVAVSTCSGVCAVLGLNDVSLHTGGGGGLHTLLLQLKVQQPPEPGGSRSRMRTRVCKRMLVVSH